MLNNLSTLAEKGHRERRRRDDLGQQEEEDGQREEDRYAEGDLQPNHRSISSRNKDY